jgi:DNA-directed RNA polymerase subunit K/omega
MENGGRKENEKGIDMERNGGKTVEYAMQEKKEGK